MEKEINIIPKHYNVVWEIVKAKHFEHRLSDVPGQMSDRVLYGVFINLPKKDATKTKICYVQVVGSSNDREEKLEWINKLIQRAIVDGNYEKGIEKELIELDTDRYFEISATTIEDLDAFMDLETRAMEDNTLSLPIIAYNLKHYLASEGFEKSKTFEPGDEPGDELG